MARDNNVLRIELWKAYTDCPAFSKNPCFCCRQPLEQARFVIGHVIAASTGGPKTADNCRPICQVCNSNMSNINMFEWMEKAGLSRDPCLDCKCFQPANYGWYCKVHKDMFDTESLSEPTETAFNTLKEMRKIRDIKKFALEHFNSNTSDKQVAAVEVKTNDSKVATAEVKCAAVVEHISVGNKHSDSDVVMSTTNTVKMVHGQPRHEPIVNNNIVINSIANNSSTTGTINSTAVTRTSKTSVRVQLPFSGGVVDNVTVPAVWIETGLTDVDQLNAALTAQIRNNPDYLKNCYLETVARAESKFEPPEDVLNYPFLVNNGFVPKAMIVRNHRTDELFWTVVMLANSSRFPSDAFGLECLSENWKDLCRVCRICDMTKQNNVSFLMHRVGEHVNKGLFYSSNRINFNSLSFDIAHARHFIIMWNQLYALPSRQEVASLVTGTKSNGVSLKGLGIYSELQQLQDHYLADHGQFISTVAAVAASSEDKIPTTTQVAENNKHRVVVRGVSTPPLLPSIAAARETPTTSTAWKIPAVTRAVVEATPQITHVSTKRYGAETGLKPTKYHKNEYSQKQQNSYKGQLVHYSYSYSHN